MADDQEGSSTNEIIMGAVFLGVFVPGAICLAIMASRWRRMFDSRVLLLAIGLYLLAFILRIVQAATFLGALVQGVKNTPATDSFVNYWMPFLVFDIQYLVLVVLLGLWDSLIIRAYSFKVMPKRMRIALLCACAALFAVTLILLGVLQPTGAAGPNNPRFEQSYVFRAVYLAFIFPLLVALIPCYIYFWRQTRNLALKRAPQTANFARRVRSDQPNSRQSLLTGLLDQIGIYSVVLVVIFIVRMILDLIMLLLQTDSEILLRIFEFLWHSLPELVLTYTFIAISWNQTTFRFADDEMPMDEKVDGDESKEKHATQ